MRQGSNIWMIIPGVVFIALGLSIIVFPQIPPWLVAIALICMGFAMLVMVSFMRGIGTSWQDRSQ